MNTVRPDKITLARESRGLTQTELAQRLNISQGQVSKIELGAMQVSPDVLARMSAVLNYPEELFSQTDTVYGAGPNDRYHRKRQSTSVGLMKKIYAQINLRRMQIVRLLRSVPLAPSQIPKYPIEDAPGSEVEIAAMVRAAWHLPFGPIANLTNVVERAGAIIVPCNFETPQVDAISQWIPEHPPMLFVNIATARSRYRMTLAHEIAHLVLHAIPNEEMEDQANRFASELLMPARDIRPDLSSLASCRRADDVLSKLVELKMIWRVSIQGLLTKLSDLGILSSSLVTSTWKRLAQLGYRKREPYEEKIPAESPSTLREIVSRHMSQLGYSLAQLSHAVCLSAEEFRRLYMPIEIAHLRAV